MAATNDLITSSGQYKDCRNARNPHHKCNDDCLARIRREAELYGPAVKLSGRAEGRWPAHPVTRLAHAEPVARFSSSAPPPDVALHIDSQTSTPVVVTGVQQCWKAPSLWSFEFFREAFGAERVVCADKVPARPSETPPAQSHRETLRDVCDYCVGRSVPALTQAEKKQGAVLQVADWPALSAHPALAEHIDFKRVIPDATPEDTPQRRELSKAMTRLLLAPPGAMTRLHTPENGTHLCIAQLQGRRQVVLYPPAFAACVESGDAPPGHSDFSPFRPDFDAYPQARGVSPHTAVLGPGDVLVAPAGWWLAHVSLEPSVAVARNFVTPGATLMAFTDALEAAERSAAAAAASAAPASQSASPPTPTAGPAASQRAAAAPAATASPARAVGALPFAAAPATSVAGVDLSQFEEKPEPQDDPAVDIYTRVARHKELGNALFKAGQFREATDAFTKAIALLELEEEGGVPPEELNTMERERGVIAVCLANRAACWLRRKQWRRALADCNRVIRSGRMDGIIVKAYFRRGKAHEGLGDVDSALADFRRVAELQPYNKEAAEELESCNSILHRLTVMTAADADVLRKQQCAF